MRQPSFVLVGSVLWAMLGLAQVGAAQPVASPTIHRVTLRAETGVLTITGAGLGPDLLVTVDGQPVSTLSGASDTQVEVLAPSTLLTTPGTYRLTVLDPVRQVGDGFVVASPMAGMVLASGGTSDRSSGAAALGGASAGETWAARTPTAPAPASLGVLRAPVPGTRAVSPAVVENGCNTAIGILAFASNTTGCYNTASGYAALYANTAGRYNTANGDSALLNNTTGNDNTASGYYALFSNTTGYDNTASGIQALTSNTTGYYNTASGYKALNSNATGDRNTASGAAALYANTTGFSNTANGEGALYGNTTGAYNAANGAEALFANTTGNYNTAQGYLALYSNTTGGENTSTGRQALYANTTGLLNTATGGFALGLNTTGSFNTATGDAALYTSTGSSNTALGNAAGFKANTGSYNLFLGANVQGTNADTNTIRIGLPYSGGVGQNKTFVAGIYNTALDASNSVQAVWVDKNGQLGTVMPTSAGGSTPVPLPASRQPQTVAPQAAPAAIDQLTGTVQAQQVVIAELRERLARLEALLAPAAGRNVAR